MMQPASSAATTVEVSMSPLPVQSMMSRICAHHRVWMQSPGQSAV